MNCPLDCPFLRQAHEREKGGHLDPKTMPNADIQISEKFLEENAEILELLARSFFLASTETAGAVDYDVREAMASLIQTYRTLQSGIYYEARPQNLLAADICAFVKGAIAEFSEHRKIRDAAILGILVFLQRIELNQNNGRKKGRAFIDLLRKFFPEAAAAAPSLLLA
ncbi:MAG: hypothetical protein M3Z85_13860 [Acidobacteriota bacterium]|nr:hypothetical protein [Acidobacteriota bacterium]